MDGRAKPFGAPRGPNFPPRRTDAPNFGLCPNGFALRSHCGAGFGCWTAENSPALRLEMCPYHFLNAQEKASRGRIARGPGSGDWRLTYCLISPPTGPDPFAVLQFEEKDVSVSDATGAGRHKRLYPTYSLYCNAVTFLSEALGQAQAGEEVVAAFGIGVAFAQSVAYERDIVDARSEGPSGDLHWKGN